ncbi:hypothetical protein BC941DRAFT_410372 [Chlamydoabsidia padenii]|nr:hypothetical protein BC941DRAFT_410372 [Chlamydoabsidia padenii]
MASTTLNQYYNKLTYKPYDNNQYSSQHTFIPESTMTNIIHQQQYQYQFQHQFLQSELVTIDNTHPNIETVSSSYPMMCDNNCSVWQNTYPTDYLGLTTFDHHQESSSPTYSALSSLSSLSPSQSTDNMVHQPADDFCVSDLLDSQSHYMLSPTCTNTTITSTALNDPYYAQQTMPQQHLTPKTEYWVSPATPLMESMDGFNNLVDQPYFKQEETDSIYMPLTKKRSANKKIHHCPHCHHTSNRANNMKEHILTHDPYRPKLFACNICQKRFARKHDMKRHTKSHQKVQRRQSKSSTTQSNQQKGRKQ